MKNKKSVPAVNLAELQPDELNALKDKVQEYTKRKQNILNEIDTLKEDLKTLDEEFANQLDMKTLRLVEAHFKLQAKIQHKDTFDVFVEALEDPAA